AGGGRGCLARTGPRRRPAGAAAPQSHHGGTGPHRPVRPGRLQGLAMDSAWVGSPPPAREGGLAVPEATIEAYYLEDRTFPPPDEFRGNALVSDAKLYEEAEADWEGFWAAQARELVSWFDDFDTVLDWD